MSRNVTLNLCPNNLKHIRGGIYFCNVIRQIVYEHPFNEGTLLTINGLKDIVMRSTWGCKAPSSITASNFNGNALLKLWSIGNVKDVRNSTILHQSAKDAIVNCLKKVRKKGHCRTLRTQGLEQQLFHWSIDPHAFGHPAMQHRSVEFIVFKSGRVQMRPKLRLMCLIPNHLYSHPLNILRSKKKIRKEERTKDGFYVAGNIKRKYTSPFAKRHIRTNIPRTNWRICNKL